MITIIITYIYNYNDINGIDRYSLETALWNDVIILVVYFIGYYTVHVQTSKHVFKE